MIAQPSGTTSTMMATNNPTSSPTVRQSAGELVSMSSPPSSSPVEPRGIAMAKMIASTIKPMPTTIGNMRGPTGSTFAKPASRDNAS